MKERPILFSTPLDSGKHLIAASVFVGLLAMMIIYAAITIEKSVPIEQVRVWLKPGSQVIIGRDTIVTTEPIFVICNQDQIHISHAD